MLICLRAYCYLVSRPAGLHAGWHFPIWLRSTNMVVMLPNSGEDYLAPANKLKLNLGKFLLGLKIYGIIAGIFIHLNRKQAVAISKMLPLNRRISRITLLALGSFCLVLFLFYKAPLDYPGASNQSDDDKWRQGLRIPDDERDDGSLWASIPHFPPSAPPPPPNEILDMSKEFFHSFPGDDGDRKILFAVESPRNMVQRRSLHRASWISHLHQVDNNAGAFFVLPSSEEDKWTQLLKSEELKNDDIYWVKSSSPSDQVTPSTVEFLKQYFQEKCHGTRCEFQWLCKVDFQSYVSVRPLVENILRRSDAKLQRALVADSLPYGHYRMGSGASRAAIDDKFFCLTADLLRDLVETDKQANTGSATTLEDLISSKEGDFVVYNPGSILNTDSSLAAVRKDAVSRYPGPNSVAVNDITDDSRYLQIASEYDISGWIGGSQTSLDDPEIKDVIEGADNILLLIKTGASVLWQRLPIHFSTTFRYIKNYQIYSDVADQILNVPVIDAFANVSAQLAASDDMKLSRLYRQMHDERQNIGAEQLNTASDSWRIDRFKVLFPLYHAWKMDSTKDWYVIVDDDSYIFWRNTVAWLRELNPNDKLVMGNRYYHFAHGGSGTFISRAVMEAMFEGDSDNWLEAWEEYSEKDCCGDGAFGFMLRDRYNVTVNEHTEDENDPREPGYPFVYSRFQKESTAFVRFQPKNLCSPAGSLHHIRISEISRLQEFEEEYGADPMRQPMLLGNVYEYYQLPFITPKPRKDWDNMPEADRDWTYSDMVKDLGECRQLCEDDKDCYQYQMLMHNNEAPDAEHECILASFFCLGRHLIPKELEYKTSISGWMTERIQEARNNAECSELLGTQASYNPRGLPEGWFFNNATGMGMSVEDWENEKKRVNGFYW